jgi:uncharacterized protein
MDCPVCGERLKEIERSGVTLDICPSCKGVWLDRGEIDKIIQAEAGRGESAASAPARDDRLGRERREHDDHDHDDDHDDHDRKRYEDSRAHGQMPVRKRKTSLLQDLLGGLGGD